VGIISDLMRVGVLILIGPFLCNLVG